MRDLSGKGFRELTCEELKEVQGGMVWWKALILMVAGFFLVGAAEAQLGFWDHQGF